MAVEDLHWIDKSSEERFKYLLDSISGARVYLIFTYRPEYVHTWGGKSFHSQVTLNRLSNRESLAMVAYLLGTEKIDRDLEELILEKTEGVPFFIEEFIKSLQDLKIIERKENKYYLAKDHPRCDNGQSGLPFRGCEGGSSDWLSRRPRVQPRFNRKGVGPI
jgi:predicted ATPase